jgi:hypothetical protein
MKKYIVINKNEELEFTGKNTPYPIEQALSLYDGLGGNFHGYSVISAPEKPALKFLGFKKIIIESNENSEMYAILCVNEHNQTARLDYFDKGIPVTDFDHDGTMMFCERMADLAKVKCSELNVQLITF